MLSYTKKFQENLNKKICLEYDIANVKFQIWDISLQFENEVVGLHSAKSKAKPPSSSKIFGLP